MRIEPIAVIHMHTKNADRTISIGIFCIKITHPVLSNIHQSPLLHPSRHPLL